MICPPPRWMASECRVTSWMSKRTPRMGSSATQPSFDALTVNSVLQGRVGWEGVPLECGDTRILDFVQVLNGLGLINQQVCTCGVGTETPDLSGVSDVPAIFVSKNSCASLGIVTRRDFAGFDLDIEFFSQRLSLHVETVMFVGRLGESDHAGFGVDGFTVRDDRVGFLQWNTCVVF